MLRLIGERPEQVGSVNESVRHILLLIDHISPTLLVLFNQYLGKLSIRMMKIRF